MEYIVICNTATLVANGVRLIMSKRYKKYVCVICGYVYSEASGDPDNGIPPGTRYEDLPDDWLCPDCLLEKKVFKQFGSKRQSSSELVARDAM